jgi:predicted metalloprotease with PDZ domain
VVRFVSDRGPARAAGLTGGEEITAIDGVTLSDLPADRPIDWGSERATRTLTLADGRTITLTLARYY